MNAEAAIPVETRPRWRRQVSVVLRRRGIIPLIEIGTVLALIATAGISYLIIAGRWAASTLLSPPLVAGLLIANLVPAMALMVLIARRLALRRAAQTGLGLKSRLPVRLVALFSVIASVPTLLVVIFASLLFQYGVEFWFSDRARAMLENAASLAQANYDREVDRVGLEATAMSGDLAGVLQQVPIESPDFAEAFAYQLYARNLSEAIIFQVAADRSIQSLALVNPYDRPLENVVSPEMIADVRPEAPKLIVSNDRFAAVTVFPFGRNTYVYTARVFEPELARQLERGAAVLKDYRTLVNRSRSLQLRFNAALFALSLLTTLNGCSGRTRAIMSAVISRSSGRS